MPELVFFRRGDEVLRFALEGAKVVLGRGEQCDIVLPDPQLSRQHMALVREGEQTRLEDLSGKGIVVGGITSAGTTLTDGMDILLGQWRAIFRERTSGHIADETHVEGTQTEHQQSDQASGQGGAQVRTRSGQTETIHKWTNEVLTVGKDSTNDIVLSDKFVSSKHLRLSRVEGGVKVVDAGSTNGTFVGPVRLYEGVVPMGTKSVSLRPSLFPLGVAIRSNAMGGTISGAFGALTPHKLRLTLDDLDPSKGNLKAFSGLDLEGKLNGKLAMDIPAPAPAPGKPGEPDLSLADGQLALEGTNLLVKGGTMPGLMYDLPRIPLGKLDARVKIDKGTGTLEQLSTQSQELEIRLAGTLKLARKLDYTESNLTLRIKADPKFVQGLGIAGAGLSILAPDSENPGFRVGTLTGHLRRPNFRPGK